MAPALPVLRPQPKTARNPVSPLVTGAPTVHGNRGPPRCQADSDLLLVGDVRPEPPDGGVPRPGAPGASQPPDVPAPDGGRRPALRPRRAVRRHGGADDRDRRTGS